MRLGATRLRSVRPTAHELVETGLGRQKLLTESTDDAMS